MGAETGSEIIFATGSAADSARDSGLSLGVLDGVGFGVEAGDGGEGFSAALDLLGALPLLAGAVGFSLLGRAVVFATGSDAASALAPAVAEEALSGAGAAAAPFSPGLGSAGASALRLAEAWVFFVVVGFFAIAAHLRDLNALSADRGWSYVDAGSTLGPAFGPALA